MEIDYTYLPFISFPVFALSDLDELRSLDGLIMDGGLVIDDRNQLGDTLGKRRLQSPHQLKRLKVMAEDICGMLQHRSTTFVDSQGYCFKYVKTKFCKVQYHKIKKVTSRDTYSILTLYKVPFPIRVKRPPPEGINWVGVLYLNKHPWLPYDYSFKYCKPKRKKI